MTDNCTVFQIKPTAVLTVNTVVSVAAEKGLYLRSLYSAQPDVEFIETFYAQHADKPFFDDLSRSLLNKPIFAGLLCSDSVPAIQTWRQILGPTDPAKARVSQPYSLRARFGSDITNNGFHGTSEILDFETESTSIQDLANRQNLAAQGLCKTKCYYTTLQPGSEELLTGNLPMIGRLDGAETLSDGSIHLISCNGAGEGDFGVGYQVGHVSALQSCDSVGSHVLPYFALILGFFMVVSVVGGVVSSVVKFFLLRKDEKQEEHAKTD